MYSDPGEALDWLAREGSAAGIAEFFVAQGVTGRRDMVCECPVAVWLHRVTGAVCAVDDAVGWTTECESEWDEWWAIPPAVAEFMRRFDQGFYPDLEIQ